MEPGNKQLERSLVGECSNVTFVPTKGSLRLKRLPQAVYRVFIERTDMPPVGRPDGRLIIHPSQYCIRGLHHRKLRDQSEGG